MKVKFSYKDLVLVVLLILLTAGIAHFVITNPLGPSRLLYYLQAPIIQWETRCSDQSPEWMAGAQRYATSNMTAPASQLVYITPDSELYHCETGWKDGILGDQPLKEDARFRYASTTKTVTAIAVLDLINSQKLTLDTPIAPLLGLDGPFKDPRVESITIEHLLSHQAGWDRVRAQDAMFMRNKKPWCPHSPEKLLETTLLYSPGARTSYSNLGYCLLGLAVEEVMGKPFRAFLREKFNFQNSTLAFLDGPYLPDEVEYDTRHEEFYTKGYHTVFDFSALSSSAGLSGNASDLAIIVKESLKRGPLTILDGGMSGTCDPTKIQSCYGYGVYRYESVSLSAPMFIHGGKFPGVTSVIIVTQDHAVLVWLGAGSIRPGSNALEEFYDYVGSFLVGPKL